VHANVQQALSDRRWQSSTRLSIDNGFRSFVEDELLPAIGIDATTFWLELEQIIDELTPVNRHLLDTRNRLQQQIDFWHQQRRGQTWDQRAYVSFLQDIGYLASPGKPFQVTTSNVDPEIAAIAGPQLVVPVNNARFALNAANARWGSLYDALYGTDVISDEDGKAAGAAYNPRRGAAVINYASHFLDSAVPLHGASHGDVVRYEVETIWRKAECIATLSGGGRVKLLDAWQFIGYTGRAPLKSLLFRNNGLHIEVLIDAGHPVGKTAPANVRDILLESATTTIQDCEDSVAAVDAADKVNVYRNWLGLMQGTLRASFQKGGETQTRSLDPDRTFTAIDGSHLTLPGRSLMMVRNVGHLMTTSTVRDSNGNEVFEGILDAVVTVACALADLQGNSKVTNSRCGSIYIVKPKMHGPDEARFANTLFARVEQMFDLPPTTIKIGVMDEERRTTVNLEECIRAVSSRLAFINTGFLDRTGDEIHTSMHLGPFLPKEQIKQQPWIKAYEDRNVDSGIRCGLPGHAQIGKGMWPMPDEMKQMMDSKASHPAAGANCAWVPSPTAATLHAMHYHAIKVEEIQQQIAGRPIASLDDILTAAICDPSTLSPQEIQSELDNNAQGILGYVVRWIEQGIGCSKVPDIDNVGLMEDRATLRISSQHIANWLLHGVCTEQQVRETLRRMADVVDQQNASDPAYNNMAPDVESSMAFQAACDLIFKGIDQPGGYTEPLLHHWRQQAKIQLSQA
jgi:malate synthase